MSTSIKAIATIRQIFFDKPNKDDSEDHYIIAKAYVSFPQQEVDSMEITIKGGFSHDVFIGDKYEITGNLGTDKKYGGQYFYVESNVLALPDDKASLIHFLAKHIKNIGDHRAELIVQAFGINAIDALIDDIDKLDGLPGKKISVKIKRQIWQELIDVRVLHELIVYLDKMGIESELAKPLLKRYKRNALTEIQKNPYILQTNVSGNHFEMADKLAAKTDRLADSVNRYKAAIDFYVSKALQSNGNTVISYDKLHNDFDDNKFFMAYGSFHNAPVNMDTFDEAYKELLADNLLVEDQDAKQHKLVTKYSYANTEKTNVMLLSDLIKDKIEPEVTNDQLTDFIQDYQKKNQIVFDEDQQEGISLLLNNRISVLTGGPGTGKTTITKAITELVQHLNPDDPLADLVTLIAPTGQASQHLAEVTDLPATTIHAKLGLTPGEDDDGAESITGKDAAIDEKYIIVDESSMIDIFLLEKLLSALNEKSHILFVGDKDQLPSVGPGLVFKTLVDLPEIKTVCLSHVHRQADGSQLIVNAHRINQNKIYNPQDADSLKFNFGDLGHCDSFFIKADGYIRIIKFIIATMKKMLKNNYDLNDLVVLSPYRIHQLGSIALNKVIQNVFNPITEGKPFFKGANNTSFQVNDRVIHVINDREIGVMNGETGIIKEINLDGKKEDQYISVQYPDKLIMYPVSAAKKELELGYAITIYKAQGSEYPVVIQVIDQSATMLDRPSVYTAYTRTEKVNVMIGQTEALNNALGNLRSYRRKTLFAEKITDSLNNQ